MTDTIQDRLRDVWTNSPRRINGSTLMDDAAVHIDAQDAKIKALAEALERIARLSLDKWIAEEASAALAAAKETT